MVLTKGWGSCVWVSAGKQEAMKERLCCGMFNADTGGDGEEGEGWMWNIHVHPSLRGKGVAFKLCTRILNTMVQQGYKTCHLYVAKNNKAAINLYRKLGFLHIEPNTSQHWFTSPNDFYHMVKRLI